MVHFVVVVHGERSPGLHRESLQSIVGIIIVGRVLVAHSFGGFGSLGQSLGLRVGDGDCGDLVAIITQRAGGGRCCSGDGRAQKEEGNDGATRRTNHCNVLVLEKQG
jgi:hypothetical protein